MVERNPNLDANSTASEESCGEEIRERSDGASTLTDSSGDDCLPPPLTDSSGDEHAPLPDSTIDSSTRQPKKTTNALSSLVNTHCPCLAWKKQAMLMIILVLVLKTSITLGPTRNLEEVLAQSGMPPHPGPQENESPWDFGACQDEWNEARKAIEEMRLTDEQNT